jgi:hypothetical protein
MNRIKFWPYGALIVAGIAVVAGVVTRSSLNSGDQRRQARCCCAHRRLDGEVGINQSGGNNNESQWVQATAICP